jgi:hypothetical protein
MKYPLAGSTLRLPAIRTPARPTAEVALNLVLLQSEGLCRLALERDAHTRSSVAAPKGPFNYRDWLLPLLVILVVVLALTVIAALSVLLNSGGSPLLSGSSPPTTIVSGSLPAAPPPSGALNERQLDLSVKHAEHEAGKRAEMTNVTLFDRVTTNFDQGRKYDVVTGLVYATSASERPFRQFCYLQGGNLSERTDVIVHLATKLETQGTLQPLLLSEKDANAVGLSLENLREAVHACRFI